MSTRDDFNAERLLADPKLRPPRHRSWSEAAEEWADWNLSAKWVHVQQAERSKGMREENVNLRITLDSCEKTVYEMQEEIERLTNAKEAPTREEDVDPYP